MEIHFLRVLAGEAIPCSPEEREWVEIWGEHTKPTCDGAPFEDLKAEIEAQKFKIRSLEQKIEDLKTSCLALENMKDENSRLHKEIALQNDYLAACHTTIQKYEPLPAPMIIDHEVEALRVMQRGGHKSDAFVVYSSTDGQD